MFSFRLKFKIPRNTTLNSLDEKIILRSSQMSIDYVVSGEFNKTIQESEVINLTGNGYKSIDEALQAGIHAKETITIELIKLKVGYEFLPIYSAKEEEFTRELGLELHGLKISGREKRNLYPILGLTVYKNDPDILFSIASNPVVPVEADVNRVFGPLGKSLKVKRKLSDKELLAITLYGSAQFEESPTMKFLALNIVLESLIVIRPKPRNESVNDAIDCLIRELNEMALDKNEVEGIRKTLLKYKEKSISRSLKDLVAYYLGEEKYFGMSVRKFITLSYEIRSTLVHNGKILNQRSFPTILQELNNLVADLLLSIYISEEDYYNLNK